MIILFGVLGFGLLYVTYRSWEDRKTALGFLAGAVLCLAAFGMALKADDWGFQTTGSYDPGYRADP